MKKALHLIVGAFFVNLSGMPVKFGTDDLNYISFVFGRNFRLPARGQACSPYLHGETGQNNVGQET